MTVIASVRGELPPHRRTQNQLTEVSNLSSASVDV